MPIRPPEFDATAETIAPHFVKRTAMLIAIDGRDRSGKTTLGRFLAWYFNVSLIETDLFLQEGAVFAYHSDRIESLICRRLALDLPVIVEGIAILKILKLLGREPDLLVYVTNSKFRGSRKFAKLFKEYESEFGPLAAAHVSLELAHTSG